MPSASPSHGAAPGEPTLATVPGYEYQDAPSEFINTVNEIVRNNPEVLVSGSSHEVFHDGIFIARADLFKVQPHAAESAQFRQQLVDLGKGIADVNHWTAVSGSWQTIESESVYVVTGSRDGQRYVVYLWLHGDVYADIFGLDDAETRAFVDSYLAAAHASSA